MNAGELQLWIGKVGRVSNFRLERIIFAEARLPQAMGHLSGTAAGGRKRSFASCEVPHAAHVSWTVKRPVGLSGSAGRNFVQAIDLEGGYWGPFKLRSTSPFVNPETLSVSESFMASASGL